MWSFPRGMFTIPLASERFLELSISTVFRSLLYINNLLFKPRETDDRRHISKQTGFIYNMFRNPCTFSLGRYIYNSLISVRVLRGLIPNQLQVYVCAFLILVSKLFKYFTAWARKCCLVPSITRYLYTNSSGTKYHYWIYSQDAVRQPYVYSNGS